jgi:ubiquitin-activating enzyme E1
MQASSDTHQIDTNLYSR